MIEMTVWTGPPGRRTGTTYLCESWSQTGGVVMLNKARLAIDHPATSLTMLLCLAPGETVTIIAPPTP